MDALDTKAKIITFSSGKGGVGKTCTAVNLSILLAQQGFKVCLFDADANLANVNIMLKLAPESTLEQVISGKKSLNDIILHKAGINVIPGASGLSDFISLAPAQQKRLQATMLELKSNYDYLLIDNSAGITENVLSYIKFSDSGIIVITAEPTSLTDAFALVRVLQKRGNTKKLNVIVNNVSSKSYALKIYQRFAAAVKKHIGCDLNYLGGIVSDELIPQSICDQNPIVLQHPAAPAALNLKDLSRELVSLQKQQQRTDSAKTSNKVETQFQQPDFSKPAETKNTRLENREPVVKPAQNPPLSNAELKAELLQRINNEAYESIELKDIVESINNAYLTRFGDYAVNLSGIIADAVNMDRISESTMKHLILTLQGLYQDQYGSTLEVANIVPEIIPDEPKPEPVQNIPSQESVDRLIHLMQQVLDLKSNTHVATDNHHEPKLVTSASKSPVELTVQELADSIRYASLVGNIKN